MTEVRSKRGSTGRLAALSLGVLSFPTIGGEGPASAPDVPKAVVERVTTTLQQRFPGAKIDSIHRAPLSGLLEVVYPDQLVYVTEDAELMFVGTILDTRTREDLTQRRWNEYNAIDFSVLPQELAIKVVKGNGSRLLAVFEDPRCPYCKQLERHLQNVTDTTVYVFLYPLEQIHPGATDVANRIWCSKDRAGAWSGWMLNGTEPAPLSPECDITAIGKLTALGTQLHINSTPTLFLSDGQRARGAMSAEQLEAALAQTNHSVASKGSSSRQ
ncbi:MAG TPA: DsbC family protein [Steroidobacteraceae bacterium]|nr:DsbC family protein [Steroidobacteraceae bacterium]